MTQKGLICAILNTAFFALALIAWIGCAGKTGAMRDLPPDQMPDRYAFISFA
jgi:hypothetical protein